MILSFHAVIRHQQAMDALEATSHQSAEPTCRQQRAASWAQDPVDREKRPRPVPVYFANSRFISSTMLKSKTRSKGTSPVNFTCRLRSLTSASMPARLKVPSLETPLIKTL